MTASLGGAGAQASTTPVLECRGAIEVLRLGGLAEHGCDAFVTTRAGGVSAPPYDTLNLGDHVGDEPAAVIENRRRTADAAGVEPERLVLVRQVHGSGVVDATTRTAHSEADCIVTTDASLAIGVLVADCVPIALLDPDARVLAVVHAGWRGVAAGVVGAAVTAMAARGAAPSRLVAAIGPCIGPTAYQVGDDVAAALADAGCASVVVPDGTGRHLADLAAACAAQLAAVGVAPSRVAMPTSTTDADPRLFSDRARRPCGRFALVARLAVGGS